MIDYRTALINTDGVVFPDTKTVNATGAGTGDGTELVKLVMDQIWGSQYALMDAAGLTPDSVTEAPDTSQILEAIRKISGSPGEGVIWWKTTSPSVTGDRVLLLVGQVITISSYPELAAAVYVGDGTNATASAFYKTSDVGGTTRDTAGAYMVLPDLRGYALRGLDVAAAVDPDGAGRDIGSIQIDAMQRITGAFLASPPIFQTPSGVFTGSVPSATGPAASGNVRDSTVSFNSADSTSPNAAKTDDVETRMQNVSCQWGIRY